MTDKTYEVAPVPSGQPLFHVRYKEGGNLPGALRGEYTSIQKAWRAIENFEAFKLREKKRLATKRRLESARKTKNRKHPVDEGVDNGSESS